MLTQRSQRWRDRRTRFVPALPYPVVDRACTAGEVTALPLLALAA